MTVKVSKPAINVREELADLKKPTGIAGQAMLAAETPQEQFNLIGAGRKNMIINGAMNVAQRSSSVTGVTTNGYHVCDRWIYNRDGTEVITMSQENDAPAGFKYSTKILVTTADTSLPTATHIRLGTRLEAQDVRQLAHGTVEAKQATVSFWVKSNKTGSYSLGLYKGGLSGNTISQGYTINSSGTWEYKTLTFSADTSAGFNSSDIGEGLRVWFTLGANSDRSSGSSNTWSTSATHRAVGQEVNLFDTVNNYWQITGVCLNVGDSAINFPHESYGETLAKCQRYFEIVQPESGQQAAGIAVGYHLSTTGAVMHYFYKVRKRTEPDFTVTGQSNIRINHTGTSRNISSGTITISSNSGVDVGRLSLSGASGSLGDGDGSSMSFVGAGSLQFDAEL